MKLTYLLHVLYYFSYFFSSYNHRQFYYSNPVNGHKRKYSKKYN